MSSSAAVTVPHLADGPAMFFGNSIDSFALPYAAIIVIALALFVLFRAKHSGPRLKYLASKPKVTSVITRELRSAPHRRPGPVSRPVRLRRRMARPRPRQDRRTLRSSQTVRSR